VCNMKYINIKTGAIVNSSSIIEGDNWKLSDEIENELVDDKKLQRKTKSELFELLELKNIKYKPEQTKEELINLLSEE